MPRSWSPARSIFWQRCPYQYLLHYRLRAKLAQPGPVGKLLGRVGHAGLSAAFAARAAGVADGDGERPMMARYYPFAEAAMVAHPDRASLRLSTIKQVQEQVYWTLAAVRPPHPAAILGVELPFEIEVDGQPMFGIIDYALRTGRDSVHVRDWKFGAVSWTPGTDPALSLYGLAATRLWPWATTVTIGLYAVRVRREQIEVLNLDQARRAAIRMAGDVRSERAAAARLADGTAVEAYPPQPGAHCGGCQYRSYCPLFREVTDLPVRPGVDVATERTRLDQALNGHYRQQRVVSSGR